MELSEIKEVRETTAADEVNRFVALGWRVLAVSDGRDESGWPLVKYSLAWTGQGKGPVPNWREG